MNYRIIPLIAILAVTGLFFSCYALKIEGEAVAETEEAHGSDMDQEDKAAKERELDRNMKLAAARLTEAQLELAASEISTREAVDQAKRELALAESRLEQFVQLDRPRRLAEAELDLKNAHDSVAETAEELKQLEIMYKDQDLEDMTAEFVINRGKRDAERSMARLALQEQEFKSFKEYDLPREQKDLELDRDRKKSHLAEVERRLELELLQKKIQIMDAEAEVTNIEEEITQLKKETHP